MKKNSIPSILKENLNRANNMTLSNKEKKILCSVALTWPIILVTCIVGYLTGAWFIALCIPVITIPFVKMVATRYSREISCLIDDVFSFLNTLINPLAQELRRMKNFLFTSTMNSCPSVPVPQTRSTNTEMYFILCIIPTRQSSTPPVSTYSTLALLIALMFIQLQRITQTYTSRVSEMSMLSRIRRSDTDMTGRIANTTTHCFDNEYLAISLSSQKGPSR